MEEELTKLGLECELENEGDPEPMAEEDAWERERAAYNNIADSICDNGTIQKASKEKPARASAPSSDPGVSDTLTVLRKGFMGMTRPGHAQMHLEISKSMIIKPSEAIHAVKFLTNKDLRKTFNGLTEQQMLDRIGYYVDEKGFARAFVSLSGATDICAFRHLPNDIYKKVYEDVLRGLSESQLRKMCQAARLLADKGEQDLMQWETFRTFDKADEMYFRMWLNDKYEEPVPLMDFTFFLIEFQTMTEADIRSLKSSKNGRSRARPRRPEAAEPKAAEPPPPAAPRSGETMPAASGRIVKMAEDVSKRTEAGAGLGATKEEKEANSAIEAERKRSRYEIEIGDIGGEEGFRLACMNKALPSSAEMEEPPAVLPVQQYAHPAKKQAVERPASSPEAHAPNPRVAMLLDRAGMSAERPQRSAPVPSNVLSLLPSKDIARGPTGYMRLDKEDLAAVRAVCVHLLKPSELPELEKTYCVHAVDKNLKSILDEGRGIPKMEEVDAVITSLTGEGGFSVFFPKMCSTMASHGHEGVYDVNDPCCVAANSTIARTFFQIVSDRRAEGKGCGEQLVQTFLQRAKKFVASSEESDLKPTVDMFYAYIYNFFFDFVRS